MSRAVLFGISSPSSKQEVCPPLYSPQEVPCLQWHLPHLQHLPRLLETCFLRIRMSSSLEALAKAPQLQPTLSRPPLHCPCRIDQLQPGVSGLMSATIVPKGRFRAMEVLFVNQNVEQPMLASLQLGLDLSLACRIQRLQRTPTNHTL